MSKLEEGPVDADEAEAPGGPGQEAGPGEPAGGGDPAATGTAGSSAATPAWLVSDDPPIPPPGTRLRGVALGIDVGGTGVKGALVDLETAALVSPRVRERTPQPSTPEAVIESIAAVVAKIGEGRELPPDLPVGCGLPGVVKSGCLETAANIDRGWVEFPAARRISERLGRQALVINDADAAGLAEMAFGAGRGCMGTVILLTIGTGIGSAVFIDGHLVPNTELGHLEMRRRGAETLVSGASRERRRLGWRRWAREFNQYLARVEFYFWPDLIILGGGVSKEFARFARLLDTRAPVIQAAYLNASGIIGAAYAAAAVAAVRPSGAAADRPSAGSDRPSAGSAAGA